MIKRNLAVIVALAGLCFSRACSLADSPQPEPPVYIALEVSNFTVNVAGPVGLGREIIVRLSGSPGDRAEFTIPNVAENVRMPEVSPGQYVGRYLVAGGHDINNAAVLGELVARDGTMAPLLSAAQHISIDTSSPKLVNRVPADGDTVVGSRPVLYCGFDDGGGTGVDPSSVHIRVDGYDVTAQAFVSSLGVSYQPSAPLPIGSHSIFLQAADLAGNPVQDIWHFQVAAPAASSISGVSGSRQGPLSSGDTLAVTVHAAPGGQAACRILPFAAATPMTEIQPGLYEGKFTAQPGDSVTRTPLVVRFTLGSQVFIATLDHPVTIDAGAPPEPVVTVPGESDAFQGGVQLAGRAPAHDLVVCMISYSGRSVGGLKPFSGTALTVLARADGRGGWHTGTLDLRLKALFAQNVDTRIILTVVTRDATGMESQPVTRRLAYYP